MIIELQLLPTFDCQLLSTLNVQPVQILMRVLAGGISQG